MEKTDFLVAVNPQSGIRKSLIYEKKIKRTFESWGTRALIVSTSKEGPDSAFSLGQRAVREKVPTVVAAGGDGTANLLLNGMMAEALSGGVPVEALPRLGVIQLGTGNNFAKNLGIPSAFDKSMAVIRHGHTVSVDVGLVASRSAKKYFLNVVSFGFDALVVESARNFKVNHSFIPNSLVYFLFAVQKILLGFPSYHFVLSGPEFSMEKEACLLAVLIGPTYGATFCIAPGADPYDGLLDVCLISKTGRVKATEILIRARKGRHIGLPQVKCFKTASLTVSSSGLLACEVDGEVMPAETEYSASILPRTLKVLVPPTLVGVQTPLSIKSKAPEFQTA